METEETTQERYFSAPELVEQFRQRTGIDLHATNVGQVARRLGLEYAERAYPADSGMPSWGRKQKCYAAADAPAILDALSDIAASRGLVSEQAELPAFEADSETKASGEAIAHIIVYVRDGAFVTVSASACVHLTVVDFDTAPDESTGIVDGQPACVYGCRVEARSEDFAQCLQELDEA